MLLSAQLHQTNFASKKQDEKNSKWQWYNFPWNLVHQHFLCKCSILDLEWFKYILLCTKYNITEYDCYKQTPVYNIFPGMTFCP